MEHAGVVAETGPPDQLNQEYQVDFDPNVELEEGGLDFEFDRSYEQAEHELIEGISDDAATLEQEGKFSDADQETYAAAADDEQATATNGTKNTGDDAQAEVDYQDEIGYEDDDLVTPNINADLSISEADNTEVELANVPFEDPLESVQVADDSHSEALTHEKDAYWHQDIDFDEDHDESMNLPDELVNADSEALEEDAPEHVESDGRTVDKLDGETAHEQFGANHDNDLDEALENLSHSLPRLFDVEVIYNEECYSLFGTSDDDPESYFLSEVKELDRPLSRFLSSLRAVISDEMAPTDELVVRFDPLELEFGERSNENFLNRSLREILDCHATLGQVPGISADPVIHLTVRRDSEEHFLELLARAELVKDSPNGVEDSDMSENLDEESPGDDLNDEQAQNDTFDSENLEEHHEEVGHVETPNDAEDQDEPELQAPYDQDDMSKEQQEDTEAGADALQSHEVPTEVKTSGSGEHLEDIPAEAHSHEVAEGSAGDEQAWDEREVDATTSQHSEIPPEMSDEQVDELIGQQEDDESLDIADSIAVDGDTSHGNGGPAQDAGSNGNDPSSPTPAFLFSLHQNIPATAPPLHSDDSAGVIIAEGPLVSISASKAARELSRASQQSIAQASRSATAFKEEELWEIDYSDDDVHEATSSDNQENYPSISKPQEQGAMLLNPKRACASAVGSCSTSKRSESSNIRMSFSFDTDTDNDEFKDDDLILAFDDDPGLSTIREEVDEYEEFTITYDAAANLAEDYEDTQEPDAAETANESGSKSSESRGHVAAVVETESVHTSTTINGDEIDYDDGTVDDSLILADDGVQPSAVVSGVDDEEIGWENDEDEYEQQPASGDDGIGFEEPKEAALTSPSTAGKRSRTDETESLADETDHKRRRT